MSILQRILEVLTRIRQLIQYANDTTGAADQSIGDAVRSLVAGYGGVVPETETETVTTATASNGTANVTFSFVPDFITINEDISVSDHRAMMGFDFHKLGNNVYTAGLYKDGSRNSFCQIGIQRNDTTCTINFLTVGSVPIPIPNYNLTLTAYKIR